MTAQTVFASPGQVLSAGDRWASFLKIFAGEVLGAFERMTKTMDKHIIRTISNGKSASFPVMGRATAKYLVPGANLDDQRAKIEHNEKIIPIDGLLTSDVFITDIEEAMNHYDVRTEYSRQMGEALALAADAAVLAEASNLVLATANVPDGAGKPKGTGVGGRYVTGVSAQTAAFGQKIIEGLMSARATMTKNYVPGSERYFFCTPEVYTAILLALLPNVANYPALIDIETGNIKNVAGFEVIEVPHLLDGGVDGKHAFDAKFTAAKITGVAMHRSAVGTVKLRDLAMEQARRAEYQSDQIIGKYAMGHGGLRPESVAVFTEIAIV
ncbi:MAG: phage capsid protein [Bacilli bacterium]|nr:phage capsid protein [Bacilli bacterium]